MNKERLLNVAKALRESPNPEQFTMDRVTNTCGTPGCAIGHYVARQDLQSEFLPIPPGDHYMTDSGGTGHVRLRDGSTIYFTSKKLLRHFDMENDEYEELFGGDGCNDAQTPNAAADYIERFVADHE